MAEKGPQPLDDLIVEILLLLPVKSLLQFRCVCKSWRALISSSYFINRHLNQAVTRGFNNSTKFLLLPTYGLPYIIDFKALKKGDAHPSIPSETDKFPDKDFTIVGSCNGLICLFGNYYEKNFIIWNPSTRNLRILPNPSKYSKYTYGFGYDYTTQDYKVVVGGCDFEQWYIFALKTDDDWRTVENFPYRYHDAGVYYRGALYWLGASNDCNQVIKRFDLGHEKFKTVFTTPEYVDQEYLRILGTTKSCLCYFTCDKGEREITIWMIHEDDQSVEKFTTINLTGYCDDTRVLDDCMSIHILKQCYVWIHHRRFLILYDVHARKVCSFLGKVRTSLVDEISQVDGKLRSSLIVENSRVRSSFIDGKVWYSLVGTNVRCCVEDDFGNVSYSLIDLECEDDLDNCTQEKKNLIKEIQSVIQTGADL